MLAEIRRRNFASRFAIGVTFAICFVMPSAASATFPGEPGLIAVQRSADPNGSNIWLLDWRTGATRQLTFGDFDGVPVFSPNGEWIAFRSDASWHGYLNIWAIKTDGSGLHRLTKGKGDIAADEPTFSANGRWVAFTAETPGNGGWEIQRVALRGGHREVLIAGNRRRSAWNATYSPDGQHLAWVSGPEVATGKSVPHIFIGNTSGHHARRLTAGGAPEFSPDGRSIVFTRSHRCGRRVFGSEIDILSLDSGQLDLVKSSCSEFLGSPTFSPDGSWIVYTVGSHEGSALGFIAVPGKIPSFAPFSGLGTDFPIDEAPSWQPIH